MNGNYCLLINFHFISRLQNTCYRELYLMHPTPQPLRLASIDVFRAITMFLMIFVNDLWTLKNIPVWLGHTAAEADGMGLADTIFPAFLFIVGLSIPLAIKARKAKGGPKQKIELYILTRSLALLIMGFFHVNLEDYNSTAALIPKPAWQILITIGFFLVWLDYPSTMRRQKKFWLQAAGVLLLIALAAIYKGSDGGKITWMRPQWWGILGLIGWSYLLCALAFLISGNVYFLTGVLLFLLFFNISVHAGWLASIENIRSYVWIVGDGSMPALTMAGVVSTVVYQRFAAKNKFLLAVAILFAFGILMLLAGFCIRPLEGISKIRATPAWVMICTGISLLIFVLLIFIIDRQKKRHWFSILKPAGTSTLTCYLLPYIHYALYSLIGITLPLMIRTGGLGIIKSLLYSLAIILIVGVLEKWRLRLKI